MLWRNITLMYFYTTCNARRLSSKPYLKLCYCPPWLLFWLCDVQRENKHSNKYPQSSPYVLTWVSCHYTEAHTLNLTTPSASKGWRWKKFWLYSFLDQSNSAGRERNVLIYCWLIQPCCCMRFTEFKASDLCSILTDNLSGRNFIYHSLHNAAWTHLTDTA